MNTLRRISRPLVKTVAVGAVMVAAALPAMAIAGTAGAATTAPTLACSAVLPTGAPTCTAGFAVIGQGYSGNFAAAGTGFANDQAVGGTVTLTTTAPGVTFSNVTETSAAGLTATIDSTSATTAGFYPLTLTDDNGTATFAIGLGVDNGPQITAIAGNAGTTGGVSTVKVTGTFLNGAIPSFPGVVAPAVAPAISAISSTNDGTSLTFTVTNNGTPGTYALAITSPWPGAQGVASSSYTQSGAPTAVSITSVTPSELGIPTVNPSTVTVTISGTGFELGAAITATTTSGTTLVSSSFVNSTTITATFTVAPGAAIGEETIVVQNPDTTTVTGTNILGVGEPATSTSSGPAAPVAPSILAESGALTPGTASIIHATGSSTFPITTGSTVKVAQTGVTNPSEILTGSVVSVDSSNNATIRVIVPRFASTPLTAATTAAAGTLTVADTSGAATSGTLTVVDGASSQNLTYTGKTATSFTGVAGGTTVHAVGVLVEFPYPAATNVLTINNGTYQETASVVIHAAPPSAFTASGTGANLLTLDPGTYSINAYVPGFGFTTGSTVTFQSFIAGVPDSDGVTGTVTVVNGNTATLAVTVPAIRSGPTGDYLATPATPGQNAITLNSIANSATSGNILVGDSLTINADPFFATPETVKVTGIVGDVVSISAPLADSHTGGSATIASNATITDNSDPQSTTDTVQAILTNGAGGADVINPFFTFTTAGTITSTQLAGTVNGSGVGDVPLGASNTVGVGAKGAILNLALSQATDASAVTAWTGSSTAAGITFGAITSDAGSNITTTINVAPGTLPSASDPISFTDGLETYSGTIAVVAGPTVTAVTAVGNLTAGTSGFTIGVTGTNFVVGEMSCSTSDPAVGCAILPEAATDSTTTATVVLTPGAAMLNGTDSLTLTYSGGAAATHGAGTLAGAFTVSGQPVVTSVTPTSIPTGTDPAITVTGTGFATSGTIGCLATATDALGNTATSACTASVQSATSATILTYSTSIPTGDSVTFAFGLYAGATPVSTAVTTPPVAVQANPYENFIVTSSVLDNFTQFGQIAQGSTAVPFHIVGGNFLPGATVTLTSDLGAHPSVGTATVTSVTPNAIFGTVSILATATVGGVDSKVTLPDGGSYTYADLFSVVAAPTIVTPSTTAPGTVKAILNGTATSVTISGTGFVTGAVVTGTVAGVATFGTAVVTSSTATVSTPDKCTGLTGDTCDTITVTVTPVNYSGSTPILDGFVVTNPIGAGSATSANSITVNPVPAVTGTYYVPTFTSNAEVTVNGTGFESGITASSANPDYTVLAVASTPTTVTLLVTTDSNATSGTSSTITLTNPDTGSGTFPLNGGPNPNTATPKPKATAVHGVVHTGKTTVVTISGTHFYGQPHITSNAKGTIVRVSKDTGKVLTVRVTTKKTTPRGVHTFIIRFANGEQTNVKYSQGK
jgi:hypothetical protein